MFKIYVQSFSFISVDKYWNWNHFFGGKFLKEGFLEKNIHIVVNKVTIPAKMNLKLRKSDSV